MHWAGRICARWLFAASVCLPALVILTARLASAQPAPDPAVVGQWSAVMPWPQAAVHMVLQPDGRVLMWPATCGCGLSGEQGGGGDARVWNPATNVSTKIPNATNVF